MWENTERVNKSCIVCFIYKDLQPIEICSTLFSLISSQAFFFLILDNWKDTVSTVHWLKSSLNLQTILKFAF